MIMLPYGMALKAIIEICDTYH